MVSILKILYVDDEVATAEQMKDLYDGVEIEGRIIELGIVTNFDNALTELERYNYDIVVLDVYEGPPSEENKNLRGKEILEKIKSTVPIVVVLYTALTAHVEDLRSPIVHVASKASDDLEEVIKNVIKTGIPEVKQKLIGHIHSELTKYYWDFAEKQADLLETVRDDHLFEHLLARRLANTLDESGANQIFAGGVKTDKVHPWRMYVIPAICDMFKMGHIVKDVNSKYWIILTPSCDFAQNKADYITIAACSVIEDTKSKFPKLLRAYQKDLSDVSKKNNLVQFVNSTGNERYYFFLRSTLWGCQTWSLICKL